MNNKPYYHEEQRFNQWWFWLIITIVLPVSAIRLLMKFSGHEINYAIVIIPVLVFLLLVSMKLNTKITADGIDVKAFPLMLKARHIAWSDVEKAYTREYSPLKEYGGWGIRGFAANRAYNVSGKQGLQLVLKDGKKVLIGTQRPSEIDSILKSINKNKA